MGVISDAWSKMVGPGEQGIFFLDDQWNPVSGDVGNYEIGYGRRIVLSDTDPGVSLTTLSECSADSLQAFGGETGHEGEGWVALVRNEQLEWLLKLDACERVVDLSFEGQFIVAVGQEYPFTNTLRIPIDSPERFVSNQQYKTE